MMQSVWKIVLLLSVLLPAIASAQIYKQVDKDGRVTFTDKPVNGETAVEVSANPIISNALPKVAADAQPAADNNQSPPPPIYQSVEIIYPLNEFTLAAGIDTLDIKAATVPKLRSGHQLNVLLDGVSVGVLNATGTVTVDSIERGEHLLTAQILDQNGGVLLESTPVKIYVQRTSLQNPNHPNNKPKPTPH